MISFFYFLNDLKISLDQKFQFFIQNFKTFRLDFDV